jgi:hypothetical protein
MLGALCPHLLTRQKTVLKAVADRPPYFLLEQAAYLLDK